jgi:hypothetical protein
MRRELFSTVGSLAPPLRASVFQHKGLESVGAPSSPSVCSSIPLFRGILFMPPRRHPQQLDPVEPSRWNDSPRPGKLDQYPVRHKCRVEYSQRHATHLAACQSSLLIDKLVPTIRAPSLTMRTDALNTVRWEFGLLLGNEIRQSLAYFGIREDPLAALTGENPTCHC